MDQIPLCYVRDRCGFCEKPLLGLVHSTPKFKGFQQSSAPEHSLIHCAILPEDFLYIVL